MSNETETTEIEIEQLPIDAQVIALNETEYFNIDPADAPYIAEIRGNYFFDRNQRVHCCELTPSYFLIFLGHIVILNDGFGPEFDEYAKSAIYEKYEYCGGDDIYVHCNTVDRLIENAAKGDHYDYGNTGVSYEDSEYDDQIEGLREHFQGNAYV